MSFDFVILSCADVLLGSELQSNAIQHSKYIVATVNLGRCARCLNGGTCWIYTAIGEQFCV